MALAQEGRQTITDPQGLYRFEIPNDWIAEVIGDVVIVKSPDEGLVIYNLTLPVASLEQEDIASTITEAWRIAVPDFDASYDDNELQVIEDAVLLEGFEKAVIITYENGLGADGKFIIGSASVFEGIAYISLIDTNIITLQQRLAQFQIIGTSYKATAMEEEADLTADDLRPWDDQMAQTLETFITESMEKLEVNAASIAIVQGGEVAYMNGFSASDTPITADTLMMIGSTTKSMTTVVMAQAVDQGIFSWDTPVVDVIPNFKVKDPELTQSLTIQNLVCACTGVPRRDLELFFNSPTAEDIVASLADFEFFTRFGEAFQYSNQMVATGGYALTAALTGDTDNLFANYQRIMTERLFQPLGMSRTTFDFDAVLVDGDYAQPFAATLLGYEAIDVNDERWVEALAPAGGAWSSANEMAKYLLFLLNRGVTPSGERLVSEDNLQYIWTPQIDINATTTYGLGWILGEYKGLPIISHGGNTVGYSSEFLFLPEQGIGVVVLTNQRASALNGVVATRALELLFGQEDEMTQQVDFIVEQTREARDEAEGRYITTLPIADFANYEGTYANPDLGEITLSLSEDGVLVMDAGEFQSEIWGVEEENGDISYILGQSIIAGTPVKFDEEGPSFSIGVGVIEYTFTR